jgi:hypothetical protein
MIRNLLFKKMLSALMPVVLFAATSPEIFGAAMPDNVSMSFKAKVSVRVQKTGTTAVKPIAVYMNGKRFSIVQKNGEWGLQTTYRQLMTASPEFKQVFDKKIGEAMASRFKELATTGKKGLQAGKSSDENKARVAAETNNLTGKFTAAYAKTLDSTAFAKIPFDWRMIESSAANGAQNSTGGEGSGEQGEAASEEGGTSTTGSVLLFLGALVLAVTAFLVPILAIAWLASSALTLTTLATAVTGTILAAGAGVVFNSAMKWAATGEPMWRSYYYEVGASGDMGGLPASN